MSGPAWGLVALWSGLLAGTCLTVWWAGRDRRATYYGLGAAELGELRPRAERLAALDRAWLRFTGSPPPISTLRSAPDDEDLAVTDPREFTDSALPRDRQPSPQAWQAWWEYPRPGLSDDQLMTELRDLFREHPELADAIDVRAGTKLISRSELYRLQQAADRGQLRNAMTDFDRAMRALAGGDA